MKKKPTSLQLRIPEPCNQKWEEMPPLPGGRFCRHCEKTVVDFTTMTDEQVTRLYLRRRGRVCGHFRAGQLDKPLPLPEPVSRWQKFRTLGALLSGLLLSGGAAAQTAVLKPLAAVQATAQQPGWEVTLPHAGVLHGVITNQDGEPLVGASVALAPMDDSERILTGTVSLEKGRFDLKVPDEVSSFQLVFSYMGYEEQTLEFGKGRSTREEGMVVRMKEASHNLELVVVTAGYEGLQHVNGGPSGIVVRDGSEAEAEMEEEAAPEAITAHGVFPNPFTSDVNVQLDLAEPASLLFHLYDASGKLVFAQTKELHRGRQVQHLDFSGRHLPAGAYFLRISDEIGEVRTKPLVKVD